MLCIYLKWDLLLEGIILKILDVKSLEELKSLGKHKELVVQFKLAIGGDKKVNTKSWENLYEAICAYKELLPKKKVKIIKEYENIYFISREAEVIFYLVELSGELRLKKLGITKGHYNNKNKASKWRNDMVKIIHPDKCCHEKASEATSKLNSIYKEMVGDEK